ncbi:hypothetical protein QYF61_010478 [Mycteria americana]|uniref:Uncharacterized protein n=1 Tax=Mycteria americana TaxID=33587 RepID=A0AAN7RVB7_MYCAM|nr:hypothetical protein QYF61_010478 [Mycteria americana]
MLELGAPGQPSRDLQRFWSFALVQMQRSLIAEQPFFDEDAISVMFSPATVPHSYSRVHAKKPQFRQPLLIRLVLCCPSLDALQHLNVCLVVRGPKLNTVRPQHIECGRQGGNHFPSPAGHTISDTSQDAIGFLGHLGTLLAHIQAAVNQHPQVLFHGEAFQPLFPKPVVLHRVIVTQVQDPALSLVEPYTIGPSPSIQPVQSVPSLEQINTPTQLGVICKLTEGALDPFIQIIDKDIKQNWPQHRAMGNTACDRPPTEFNSVHHIALGPATQPVFHPLFSSLHYRQAEAKQPQFPQPLLIRLLLQTLHQLRCPSLDTLQHLNVSPVVGGPKLNTVFEDAIGFLDHLGTLLAHIQAPVNQHSQVLLCWAAFQPLFPKPVALHGVAVAQVQDLALSLVEPHTIDLGPSIQPVQVPLQSLPTLKQINTPTQLGVICKLTEGALDPFIQIMDKDIKQNWPQHRALGNTACDQPPNGVNSIHHHFLGPAIQPVLYPAKSTPVHTMSSQFLQENAMENRVKGFTEV